MELKSSTFEDGQYIPARYTCEGQDISPELTWNGVPEGTRSFVLIMDDPDAPAGTFTHWVIFNIPADSRGLAEATATERQLPDGSRQGINDFGSIGYGGPCPPPGTPHHYHLNLYALDKSRDLAAGASKQHVLNAIKGHILAQAERIGLYRR